MPSVNQVALLGHIGKDPKISTTQSGVKCATFSLATTERAYTSKNGTQYPERTEWHNLVLWRGLAEIAAKYLHKGSLVYVQGKLRTRSYDDKQGVKRYVTEIVADELQMLDRKGAASPQQQAPPPTCAPDEPQYQQGELGGMPEPAAELPF